MQNDRQVKRGTILHDPQHDAAVGYPFAASGNADCARLFHQSDFRHPKPIKPLGRSGEGMHPQIRLTLQRGEAHGGRIIMYRRLVRHQRRAGNPTKAEGWLVRFEHAKIDDARRNDEPACIDVIRNRRSLAN